MTFLTTAFSLTGLSFISALLVLLTGDECGYAEETLPGGRPMIEARYFPSLQAAIDALPAEGGNVQIPRPI